MSPKPRKQRLLSFDDPGSLTPSQSSPASSNRDSSEPELRAEIPLDDAASPRPAETTADLNLTGKIVYVVDSHSLIFQVFHALPEMSSPTGQPVGAVFGFARDMFYLRDDKQPDYLFCAFDLPGPTFRHELYDQYKIHREEMPDSLPPQIDSIRQLLAAMKIPVLECPGFEADDVLATVARITESRGGACFLVTGDKDCRQLITDRVRIFNVRKNEVFDAEALAREWGIRPNQVVDFQALVGDPVDNVPGVPLIGPKIARELLTKYGTLDEVLAHAEEVSGAKRRENLIAGRELAQKSRELVRLCNDVPVEVDWEAGRVGAMDRKRLLELFREFGFRSLAQRVAGEAAEDSPPRWQADYRTVATPAELETLANQLASQSRFCLDTETTSTSPRHAELVGLSFAWQPGEAYYVPVRAPQGEPCIDPTLALTTLRPVLENSGIVKVGQNLKYDMVVLRGAGVEVAGRRFDTMVADYLLEAGGRNHGLDELARRYLEHENIPISDLIGTGKNQRRMDEVPIAQITQYAAEDADVALRLADILQQRLTDEHLTTLFEDLEMPLIDVLVEMEYNGIKVDVNRLNELSSEYGRRMEALEQEIYALAGHPFNIASPKQLAEVLFTEQQLPVIKRTKTGPSTDVEVLEELAQQHQLPAKIIEYRQYAKLKGTYLDALPALVHPATGRVHTSLNQVVAATGRLSSNDPNLQNIPVRTEVGREIRSAFTAGEPGWQLLTADYSQIELRVLAHLSQDATLLASFAQDEDIHTRVASEVYGVPLAEVTREMRRSAKAINFGVIYGQSPFGLAKALGIEQEDAARFIEAYFSRYPGVSQLLEKILADCYKNGYVSTILGRRRAIQGVRDPSERARIEGGTSPQASGSTGALRQKNLPERTAINTVIQGSAADLIKRAMIDVSGRLRQSNLQARMLLQVHDELIFESPREELPELAPLVTAAMSGACELSVPLKVDVKSGENWAECEPI